MIWISIFIFGIAIGSFINCIIYRLEIKEGFVSGRSKCPHCKDEIKFYDLIPIISYFILRGKCRYCKQKISIQYPLVELLTGMVFLFIFFQQGILELFSFFIAIETTYLLLVFFLMIIIFIYDLKHYLIPDEAVYTAIALVTTWRGGTLLAGIIDIRQVAIYLFSGLAVFGLFLSIFILSRGLWIGFGDVKLVLFIGIFLGFPEIFIALFSSFILGAIIGSVVIVFRKRGTGTEIPFAPFLITGTALALFWGELIMGWYFNFFMF